MRLFKIFVLLLIILIIIGGIVLLVLNAHKEGEETMVDFRKENPEKQNSLVGNLSPFFICFLL